ncbi:hypothetical protein [Xenorhabdus griffiniae]|uniref:DUF3742 domain-containing protein n=1 Tax=Xenorhabdus griffiniae TaxID=351672 RepID=A0ABY9XER0_9GAMM|nr:hypothetical protein [Xenorhabdus griffiniae]MBD1226021.1 hypothetical protein [Xenorhabdus griffiniae]MBE8585861.1 hypothetical protein [Xenorhabdus griffiniae]WMV71408.1 hypothetical protein QL128_14690 [Xenorhabdus griffiniae]WNH01084.1 hypothetical protein QL112_014695 [Xenorhabdus griffiniae]
MQKDLKVRSRGEFWGIKAACIWKRCFNKLKSWDKTCVSKAKKNNVPAWIGHIPVFVASALAITALILSTIITIITVSIFFIIILVLSKTPSVEPLKHGHYDLDGYHYPDGSIDQSDP